MAEPTPTPDVIEEVDEHTNKADREDIDKEVARLHRLIERIKGQAEQLQRMADDLPDRVTDSLDIKGLKDKAEALSEEAKAMEG